MTAIAAIFSAIIRVPGMRRHSFYNQDLKVFCKILFRYVLCYQDKYKHNFGEKKKLDKVLDKVSSDLMNTGLADFGYIP